ncbi:hypothetical protein HK099_005128, partial [Clydaea vesicula]
LVTSKPLFSTSFTSPSHPGLELNSLQLKVVQPNLCDETVKQLSGYLSISKKKHIYFWFFESRGDPKRDPVVLWLNGGPGCSSFTGLMMELGPCRIAPGGKSTIFNKYGWNQNANLMFLDQPVGTGFSFSEHGGPSTSEEAAEDVYLFFQLFFKTYNNFAKNDFHIFGESYAGHYIPAIAGTIHRYNKHRKSSSELLHIRLKSVGIGNGATDMLIQFREYPTMACDTKYGPILSNATCAEMASHYPMCKKLMEKCYETKTPLSCVTAETYCDSKIMAPYATTGRNIYDIRDKCGDNCYPIEKDKLVWLNDKKIQAQLGVDRHYDGCSDLVSKKFKITGDGALPFTKQLVELLEDKIDVLIYAGDADWICNWYGVKAYLKEMKWSKQFEFNQAEDLPWIGGETGREAGEIRTAGPLTFIRVFNSGHMVPYDQPEHSLEMLNLWIKAKIWDGDRDEKRRNELIF